jgi:hypothetical protein
MPKSGRYIGSLRTGAKPQPIEATAYFSRMTNSPSTAYREAVSWGVQRWKDDGVWTMIKGLWLFCADDSQAALLSVIGDTPRDATLTGAPTFTAGKGFSNLTGANVVNFGGIGSTILADDNAAVCVAGIADMSIGDGAPMITCDAGGAATGTLGVGVGSFSYLGAGFGPALFLENNGSAVPFVGGGGALVGFTPGGLWGVTGGSGTGRSNNYRTAAGTPNPLSRLTATAFLAATSTKKQWVKFAVTLAALVNQLGALD